MTTFSTAVIAGIVTLIGAVLTWFTARGTRRDTALDRAASWWEKSVARLEAEHAEHEARIRSLEESNTQLRDENRTFRSAIREVITWLTANLEHEKSGKGPPLPYSFELLLSRLLRAIDRDH